MIHLRDVWGIFLATCRRIQHIEVTEAGRQLLAKCRTRVKSAEEELLAGVSWSDEQIIRRWLVKAVLHDSMD